MRVRLGTPFFAGVVQQQNAAVPRPRQRCDSVHPLHFCPCGVVQTTCLPLMQEITGAKPVRDANFTAPKAFERCTSLVWKPARCTAIREANVSYGHLTRRTWEVHSGWGLQFCARAEAPQSSQRSGEHHKPAAPRAALGAATIYASLQQSVDFFCKEIVPGQHRREAPIIYRASG